MNAPSPAHQRTTAAHTSPTEAAPAVVPMTHADQRAANDAAQPTVANPHGVNPLWMVTAGLVILFAVLAILATSG